MARSAGTVSEIPEAPAEELRNVQRQDPATSAKSLPPAKQSPRLQPLVSIDAPTRRQLRRGASLPQSRIDLHGLRQHDAHRRLITFLHDSFVSGHRIVLVITGKGQSSKLETGLLFDEPGVLRRSVPHWLSEPTLRCIVSGFGPAERHHGGEGALYVRLRRKRHDQARRMLE